VKTIAILGSKGGTGKSSLAHCLAYGAHLMGVKAVMVHTDQRPPVKGTRPYEYLDASANYSLVTQLIRDRADEDGVMVIDGAGNRPHVDLWVTRTVNLVLIPVTNSAEDVRCAMSDLSRFANPKARLVVNHWPSNRLVRMVIQRYADQLPGSRIIGRLPEVAAVRQFLEDGEWRKPSTRVNNLSRQLYRMTHAVLQDETLSRAAPEAVATPVA
jgi:hypothetical protein